MAFKRNTQKIENIKKQAQEKIFLENADKTAKELAAHLPDNRERDKNGKPYSNNPKAPRNYKLMTARFNKYEINILDELSKTYGVDRMNVLRIAFIALAKENGI